MLSRDTYKNLIKDFLNAGYETASFTRDELGTKGNLFLRHDVDFSLDIAEDFARINQNLGVKGTFFINFRTPLFNVLTEESQKNLSKIKECEQDIAMHVYIPSSFGKDKTANDMVQWLEKEFELFKNLIKPVPEKVISWHNPINFPPHLEKKIDMDVPGFINAYSLTNKGVKYFSDSNAKYSVESWKEIINTGYESLQILIHPFIWNYGVDKMEQALARAWKKVIRTDEKEFMTNIKYREQFPEGLPEGPLSEWVAPLENKE